MTNNIQQAKLKIQKKCSCKRCKAYKPWNYTKRKMELFSEINCISCKEKIKKGDMYYVKSSGYEMCEKCYNKNRSLLTGEAKCGDS